MNQSNVQSETYCVYTVGMQPAAEREELQANEKPEMWHLDIV
jgi:hypothetical protein